jgi:hypothetical protein
MKIMLATALALSLLATSTLAQPASDAAPQMAPQAADAAADAAAGASPANAPPQPHGDVPANAGPYAGASPKGFYDVNQRIDHLQAVLAGMPHAKRAMAQLNTIRSDLQFRMKRHGGVLRDYDRELITEKLDGLVAKYPALKS